MGEYLDRWLRDYAKPNVRQKTYDTYEQFVRLHLKPALGHIRLSQLRPLHIQQYYARALEVGRVRGGGLSKRSVHHHHRLLHSALEQAVKWQLLARNPAASAEPPQPEESETTVLTLEETLRLIVAVQGNPLYLPVLLGVTAGMRRGEILALRWQDVNMETGFVSVKQSIQNTTAGLVFERPKTKKSRRGVVLPAFMLELLRMVQQRQEARREVLPQTYDDHGLVVCQDDGRPWSPNAITHRFTDSIAKLELPRVTFHGLRHGHATHLLEAKFHAKIVSERLGHSNIGITMDLYSHVLPGMQDEAAQYLDQVFRAAVMGDSDAPCDHSVTIAPPGEFREGTG